MKAADKFKSIKFLVADAHNLPFRDKVFGVIVFVWALSCIKDKYKALQEVYRVLKRRRGKAVK